MKYRLTHQIISKELNALACKKIISEEVYFSNPSKKNLKEIDEVCKAIERIGLPDYLVLKALRRGLGSGIFLHPKAKPLSRGRVIGPYSGEVTLCQQNYSEDSSYAFSLVSDFTLTKEEQKRFEPNEKFHPKRIYSVDLDATKIGNFTRFINHSSKPNVEARLVKLNDTYEIVYFAIRTIRPKEQLLVCYEGEEKSYWGVMKIKPFYMTPQTFQLDDSLNLIKTPN